MPYMIAVSLEMSDEPFFILFLCSSTEKNLCAILTDSIKFFLIISNSRYCIFFYKSFSCYGKISCRRIYQRDNIKNSTE